jgi:hypothetical protein
MQLYQVWVEVKIMVFYLVYYLVLLQIFILISIVSFMKIISYYYHMYQ